MRLIDAKVYCMELYNEMNYAGRSEEFMTAIDVAIADLADAPTVDAVEVVRCRDCKHYRPQKKSEHWENRANYCNRLVRIKVRPNDFCSYGERKDEVSE